MTVGELKNLLNEFDDETEIYTEIDHRVEQLWPKDRSIKINHPNKQKNPNICTIHIA